MKEACKGIGRKLKNTNRMSSNEFFAYTLLFVSFFSIIVAFVANLIATFVE